MLASLAIKVNSPEMMSADPDAPFKHAPPKDGDPWTTLLTPELEVDTVRCNAWKDEVQNLLIFAGLFSAVVTAFVIESYKFLQPDPNAAIVGLLFHIASSSNNASSFPPSVSSESILTPFSQTPSAVRINVFWFISLILSLTTVLVGTIALQWLREHQIYGGYSAKEKLAMLRMRTKAAEAWCLPQVFATLPLLLQAALVLFMAGLIDFSLPLGPKLTIPVATIVGLTLLFLTATTTLPALQGLSFFFGLYPRKKVPTPCPFKSPQSHAFRALFGIIVRAIFRVFPPPSLEYERSPSHSPTSNWNRVISALYGIILGAISRIYPRPSVSVDESLGDSDDRKWIIKNRSFLIPDYLASNVCYMWYQRTWLTFDLEWLSLRDTFHQHMFDDDPDLYHHRACFWEFVAFPLSDVTQYLVEPGSQSPGSKHTESFLAALVHCFQELSESTWMAVPQNFADIQRKDRRNRYFEHLHWEPSCSLSNFLLYGGDYKFDRFSEQYDRLADYIEPKTIQWLFSQDQVLMFLRVLLDRHNASPALGQYQLELWSRVLSLSGHIPSLTPLITDGFPAPIPDIIKQSTILNLIANFSDHDQRYSAVAVTLDTLLKIAASQCISQDLSMDSLSAHSDLAKTLDLLADWTASYWPWSRKDATRQHRLQDIDDQFVDIFKFISDHLNDKRSDELSSGFQECSLNLFFYLSSIFVRKLLVSMVAQDILQNRDANPGKVVSSSIDALHKTWLSGRRNKLIEERFREPKDSVHYEDTFCQRFSDEWWSELFKHVIKQEASFAGRSSSPDASSQLIIAPKNVPEAVTSPLPTTTSPRTVDHSPNPRPQARDIDCETVSGGHGISQPGISRRESASNLNNRVDNSTLHSPFNSPAVLNHSATTMEGPDIIDDFPISHSRPLSDGPGETRALGDGPTVGVKGINSSDEHDLQPSELHFAIDVDETPSTILGLVEAEILGSEGDRPAREARPEDAVIHIHSPI